jgi:hypothetical protein
MGNLSVHGKEVLKCIMRIKPASVYEDMTIYYTIDVVSLLHVSATYCGHLHGGVFRIIYYKEHKNQFTNIKYPSKNTSLKMATVSGRNM